MSVGDPAVEFDADGHTVRAISARRMAAVGRVATLALPKTGLAGLDGDLVLADLGIPPGVFGRARVAYTDPLEGGDRIPLTAT